MAPRVLNLLDLLAATIQKTTNHLHDLPSATVNAYDTTYSYALLVRRPIWPMRLFSKSEACTSLDIMTPCKIKSRTVRIFAYLLQQMNILLIILNDIAVNCYVCYQTLFVL